VFAGEVVPPEQVEERDNVFWALALGACADKSPCSWKDQQMIACATVGRCYADQRAYLEAQLVELGRQPSEAGKILEMAEQVRRAVASRNVAFFVR